MTTEAHRRLDGFVPGETPAARADHLFTRGWLAHWRGDAALAEQLYRDALRMDPYHRQARVAIVGLLRSRGREAEAAEVIWSGRTLALPLGPDFERELGG
jgi:hypothetical protein